MTIKNNYLIEKRNILNEIRPNSMSLQELRLFSIYLAKINARDVSTKVVRFSISEFQKIMDLGKLNLSHLKYAADNLLTQLVDITFEDGTIDRFQLFSKYSIKKNENDEWYVEIVAHDSALPLMFEFKERYFTYELWNALRLKSTNQLRMYELLKQYENLGERIIKVDDLKKMLGMEISEHPRFNNFKVCVLNVCQEALETYTDIKFVYEPVRKKGKGGKINAIKFTISKNESYVDPISLAEFINVETEKVTETDDIIDIETEFQDDSLDFLSDACKNEFNKAEIQVLYNLIIKILPHKVGDTPNDFQLRAYDHLKHRYDELNWRASRNDIKNRFAYLRKLLEADIIMET